MLTWFKRWRKLRGGRWLRIDMVQYGSYVPDDWIKIDDHTCVAFFKQFNNRILDEESYGVGGSKDENSFKKSV